MTEDELRKNIYEYLGLEIGSLSSESGNDWQRARNEVLEEAKKKEFMKLNEIKLINYQNIPKDSLEFLLAINSDLQISHSFKVSIAQRKDLNNEDINKLIKCNDKDVLINLAKYQNLSEEQLDFIIPKSVYLVKKNLIENQKLNNYQKQQLIEIMTSSTLNYNELINKLKLINY